ncbi:MAG: Dam family site-specific DNA-(adenine-N6)-methyltransferase [Candidatus Omnitrophota bacterium]
MVIKHKIEPQSEAKPFLKWAGGKTRLLKYFREYYPRNIGREFKRYSEPFVGSGAVFFDLVSQGALKGKEVVLADSSNYLINCYKQLQKSTWLEVLRQLNRLTKQWQDNESYSKNKDEYNELIEDDRSGRRVDLIRCAALFIFLNKTCFNGVYRVNSKGYFNVPKGKYAEVPVFKRGALEAIHSALRGVKLMSGPYKQIIEGIKVTRNDFLYMDPPYIKLSKTSSFTGYQQEPFGMDEQKELAEYCVELQKKGCYSLISNHWVECIKELYPKDYFKYKTFSVSRCINSIAERRGNLTEEVLIISKEKETN